MGAAVAILNCLSYRFLFWVIMNTFRLNLVSKISYPLQCGIGDFVRKNVSIPQFVLADWCIWEPFSSIILIVTVLFYTHQQTKHDP